MHVTATGGKGRRIGILAVAAVLAAGSAAAQGGREASEGAGAQVRAFFNPGAASYIGVQLSDVEDGAGAAGAEDGAVVTEVVDGAPADAAGIEAGDVIVEFDGERVRSVRQLTRIVGETPAGRTVAATILRNGARVAVNVTPGERPRPAWLTRLRRLGTPESEDLAALEGLPDFVVGAFASLTGRSRLGIRGDSVDGQLADFFGVSAGVLVRHVEEDTVAEAAGLRAGDVITAIDGEAVDDLGALRRRLSALDPGASFTIGVGA